MLKSIIVAHDASEMAAAAFAYALEIARAASVPVLVLRAIEPVSMPPALPDPAAGVAFPMIEPMDLPEVTRADRQRAERELAELRAFAQAASVEINTRIVDGFLLDALREAADPTDLIAVGMTGRFRRAGVGSSTKALVVNGPCPVLVAGGPLRNLSRVLGVYDGTGPSRRAIAWCIDLAEQTGWPQTVLAVSSHSLSLDDALAQAQRLAPDAQVIHYGPDDESKAHQIKTTADHASSALLVIGAYADSWLHQLLFGTTSDHVLKAIDAPAVLVH